MAFRVRSMVNTSARAEITKATKPKEPRRLALLVNWVK
jgi:hypothetical protein